MVEEQTGTPDPSEQETSEETTTEEEVTDETPKTLSEEEITELKKKADLADNYKTRAEKAETKLKKSSKPKEEAPKVETPKGGLSDEDLIYVAKSDIHDEDLSEVREYAEKHEVSIREAHKYLKPVLDVKTQERKTAEATQTKGGKRGASNISGEAMLKEASQDNMVPEDDKGIEALVAAEMAAKEADLPKRQ